MIRLQSKRKAHLNPSARIMENWKTNLPKPRVDLGQFSGAFNFISPLEGVWFLLVCANTEPGSR